ncbi:MAG: RNA pseudouridine synthase [Phycisphaerae bacterium]|nr:RNA pseudouridine synthase [Phycisphaerae bacterium]
MNPSADEPSILRETSEWLVVDKPAGWHSVALPSTNDDPSSASRGDSSSAPDSGATVEAWLRRRKPELAALHEAGLVHRLDRETSGCLLAAKHEGARAALRDAMSREDRAIRKVYLAVTAPGAPDAGSFTLHFHGRHKRSSKVTVSERGEAQERGRCRWSRISRGEPGDLLEVELIGPGRRHQIRAGFAHLGFPLAGDALYGGGPPLPGLAGAALHAWMLEIDGGRVVSPAPAPWSQVHEAIRRRLSGTSSETPTSAG